MACHCRVTRLGKFSTIRLLFVGSFGIFEIKKWPNLKMATPLATSLLHSQLNKMFKNMVCILALFGLATVLATFQKILGNFFQIIWSPCLPGTNTIAFWTHSLDTKKTECFFFFFSSKTAVK